jgi:hypothetical protein
MIRLYIAALLSLALTVAYAVLALTESDLANALALLYVIPLLTFTALRKPR